MTKDRPICPDCKGEKRVTWEWPAAGYGDTYHPKGDETVEVDGDGVSWATVTVDCPLCDATGTITPEIAAAIEKRDAEERAYWDDKPFYEH